MSWLITKSSIIPTLSSNSTPSANSVPVGGIVAGSVIGGIAAIALITMVILRWIKRRKIRANRVNETQGVGSQQTYPPNERTINGGYDISPAPPVEPYGAPLNQEMDNDIPSGRINLER